MHEVEAAPDEKPEVEKAWVSSHNMRVQDAQRWHAAG